MLNFGVATWWLLRPGPSAPLPWVQPADVPRLQLLGEQVLARANGVPEAGAAENVGQPADDAIADPSPVPAAEAPVAATVDTLPPASTSGAALPDAATAPAETASAMRCSSFGPFADAVSVATARNALQPLGAARMRVRDVVQAPRGWRVVMAPQPDRAAADALAATIRDAGFDDLLVVPSGDEANGIALGRYGSESSARRRESALRAAGFPAQAQPLGEVAVQHWLDVAAGPAFNAAAARGAAGAAQVVGIDCAGIVADGASR